jgi:hypothetical protein
MKFVLGFMIGLIIASCASIVIPTLDNRTLLVSPDSPELIYPYCKEKGKFIFWEKKDCKTFVIDRYDLTNEEIRKELKSFVCIHEKRLMK